MIMMNSAENFWPIFLWNRSQDVEGSCFVALCRSIIPSGHAYQKKLLQPRVGNEEKLKPTSESYYIPLCVHTQWSHTYLLRTFQNVSHCV